MKGTSQVYGWMMILVVGWSSLFGQHVLSPEDSALQLGHQHWQAGDYEQAYLSYRMAQKLAKNGPTWSTATYSVGKYYARTMELGEAAQTLDSVIVSQEKIGALHPSVVLARRERANVEMFRGNVADAIEAFRTLAKDIQALPSDQDSIRAMCINALGHAYLQNREFENAKNSYAEAMAIRKRTFPPNHIEIAYSENAMGMIYGYQDQHDSSLVHYLRAEEIFAHNLPPSHPNLIQIRTNIGIHYADLGQFWRSLSYHKANLPHIDGIPLSPRLGVLCNLASMLLMVRDYEASLEYLAQAEQLNQAQSEPDPGVQAYIADERARIYRDEGRYDLAMGSIEEAIAINADLYGPTHTRLISIYTRKGLLLEWMEQYTASEQAFRYALQLADLNGEEQSIRRGMVLEYLGEALIEKGEIQQAIEVLEESKAHYQKMKADWNLSGPFLKRSIAMQKLGKWEEAEISHRKAWEVLLPEIPYQQSPPKAVLQYWQSYDLKDLLEGQALLYQGFFAKTNEIEYLHAALDAYETALGVVDSQRHYFLADESKQTAVQFQLPMYESAIGIAYDLFQLEQESSLLERAMHLAEKSKANSLREHLRGATALQFGGVPDSLLEKERQLRQQLASWESARAERKEENNAPVADPSFSRLNQTYRSFLRQLEQEYPAYYQLKYPGNAFSLNQLSEKLAPSQAAYSYFYGERSVFVFRLFRGQLSMSRISEDSRIEESLRLWTSYISSPPSGMETLTNELVQTGFQLFQALMPEMSEEMEEILIIPDGLLGYLPFESLLTELTQNTRFRELAYLGTKCAISYSFAGELWLQRSTGSPKEDVRYLGIAPNFRPGQVSSFSDTLLPLMHNQEEVQQVSLLIQGENLLGNQATEKALKQLTNEPLILHFATHALADESNLMNSRLFFATDSSSGEDGVLFAHEIYQLDLNSPLIVLSACQTGTGPLVEGEGIMSLARAFQYAGSQRVLTTLWQIDDRAASALSTSFFEEITADIPSSIALYHARQRWMAESDNYHCHPYFWSGFVLIGDGGNIYAESNREWMWLLLVLAGSLLVIVVGVIRSKM